MIPIWEWGAERRTAAHCCTSMQPVPVDASLHVHGGGKVRTAYIRLPMCGQCDGGHISGMPAGEHAGAPLSAWPLMRRTLPKAKRTTLFPVMELASMQPANTHSSPRQTLLPSSTPPAQSLNDSDSDSDGDSGTHSSQRPPRVAPAHGRRTDLLAQKKPAPRRTSLDEQFDSVMPFVAPFAGIDLSEHGFFPRLYAAVSSIDMSPCTRPVGTFLHSMKDGVKGMISPPSDSRRDQS
jgi:hypothetical protein